MPSPARRVVGAARACRIASTLSCVWTARSPSRGWSCTAAATAPHSRAGMSTTGRRASRRPSRSKACAAGIAKACDASARRCTCGTPPALHGRCVRRRRWWPIPGSTNTRGRTGRRWAVAAATSYPSRCGRSAAPWICASRDMARARSTVRRSNASAHPRRHARRGRAEARPDLRREVAPAASLHRVDGSARRLRQTAARAHRFGESTDYSRCERARVAPRCMRAR